MQDIDIIRKVKAGDAEAFSALVEKYHRRLLNFIYTLTDDAGTVEDIGQEVFLSVYKSLEGFDEKKGIPFSAWLFIIARNRCISELRGRRGKKTVSLDGDYKQESPARNAEDMLGDKEKVLALRASLEQLPEHYRDLILRRLNGDTLEEISAYGGIPIGTVKSRLFRTVRRMKILVSEYFGGKGYEEI